MQLRTAYSSALLLAGGGVKRGYVHGASDRRGMYPADKPVRPDDLAATMFHLLGIDPHAEVRDALNRLDAAGVQPHHVALREPTLDDVFLTLTSAASSSTTTDDGASA